MRALDEGYTPTGRIRKKKAVDGDVLSLARERVREAYELFDHIAVSFSGGKDSTAVLNITIEVARELGRLPLDVIFFDEEAIEPQTVEYMERIAARPEVNLRWLCLPVQCRNACSRKHPHWWPWEEESRDLWVRPLPANAITAADVPGFPADRADRPTIPDAVGLLFPPLQYGRVGMLLGIRSQESLTRMRAVLMRSQDTRPHIRPWNGGTAQGNLSKVYPIYDWMTEDIWTATGELQWDYNRSYDAMYKSGFSANAQRIGAAYGEEPLRALWFFREAAPLFWDKMCRRVPGAATAARYSTTQLYSYGKVPEKPGDMTPEEWLRYWLMKHPPDYRQEIAARVQNWIRNHFKKTKDPLAAKAPHPSTGLSWNFLIKIAIRGDYKDRTQPSVNPAGYEKNKARYDAEIALMRGRGEI